LRSRSAAGSQRRVFHGLEGSTIRKPGTNEMRISLPGLIHQFRRG
jgi:hypothetical protein